MLEYGIKIEEIVKITGLEKKFWENKLPCVEIYEFIVMPNHFHGLVETQNLVSLCFFIVLLPHAAIK